jgi:hypothetical protein
MIDISRGIEMPWNDIGEIAHAVPNGTDHDQEADNRGGDDARHTGI